MTKRTAERGSALMLVVIIVLILVGISGAYVSVSMWNQKRAFQDEAGLQALYIAETAAAAYISDLNGGKSPGPVTEMQNMALNGSYLIPETETVYDNSGKPVVKTLFIDYAKHKDPLYNDANYVKFQVQATYNGVPRRLNVLLNRGDPGANKFAIAALNFRPEDGSNDSTYSLDFGNSSTDPSKIYDKVLGKVYSGNNLKATGTAQLWDETGATGAEVMYKGTDSSDSSLNPKPTMKKGSENAMDLTRTAAAGGLEATVSENVSRWEQSAYDARNQTDRVHPTSGLKYVDVAHEMNKNGVTNKWVDGSTATDILDANNPAHIFRKNPSSTSGSTRNRTELYEYTTNTTAVKDSKGNSRNDYYLEDPTNKNVTVNSLSGVPVNGDTTASMINVNQNGNEAVYFIDGNMRISGEPVKSYQINPGTGVGDIKMTIVVKGNVSLTDNLLYPEWMSKKDAVAIVALTDPEFPNVVPSDFATNTGSKMTPNGVSLDTFLTQYNAKAQAARNAGLQISNIDVSTAAGRERAAQEYNKIYGSGNVYFGDPGSGTVEHFESFMFAENNFYTTNLDTTKASGGTQKIEIYGNMTAGNQVKMPRDQKAGYVPLNVTYNSLIAEAGGPPDLPRAKTAGAGKWSIASWKQDTASRATGK